jgi:hypothetical protein
MNLDSLVQQGHLPWSPNAAVTGIDVWQEYEMPLVGTFESAGHFFLFTVIGTPTENGGSVWAYVELSAPAPECFGSLDEMRGFVTDSFKGNEAVFALASDLLIVRWSRVLVDDLYGAANTFLNGVIEAMADPRTSFHARLAGIDDATAYAEMPGGELVLA